MRSPLIYRFETRVLLECGVIVYAVTPWSCCSDQDVSKYFISQRQSLRQLDRNMAIAANNCLSSSMHVLDEFSK